MKINRFAVPALALFLGVTCLGTARANGVPQGPPPPGYGYGQSPEPWAQPPQELREIERHGFHDGIEAARDDFNHRRQPDVNRHETFRHPDVSREDRRPFRDAFRRGYQLAISHLTGGPGPR
jgi:hypothetical protein